MNDVTALLQGMAEGRADAASRLFPLVYEQLREMARGSFQHERGGHTLQPTALVHEAFIRMAQPGADGPRTRLQFQALAATVMRHVLIDHARSRNAAKRGGERTRIALGEADIADPRPDRNADVDVEALDAALRELSELSERPARLVELRYFGGMSIGDAARILGVSESSAERDWRFARAWLMDRLTREHDA